MSRRTYLPQSTSSSIFRSSGALLLAGQLAHDRFHAADDLGPALGPVVDRLDRHGVAVAAAVDEQVVARQAWRRERLSDQRREPRRGTQPPRRTTSGKLDAACRVSFRDCPTRNLVGRVYPPEAYPNAHAREVLHRRRRPLRPSGEGPAAGLSCSPRSAGVEVIPVWNKSNREHTIIGSEPASVRAAADAAVKRTRLDEAVPRRRRPHPPRHRRPLPRRRATSSPSTWPTRSASRRDPAAVKAFVDRHPRARRHASTIPGHRASRSRSRRADVERDRRRST